MKNKYIIPVAAAAGLAFVLYLIWRKNKLDKEAGEKAQPEDNTSNPGATGGTGGTGGTGAGAAQIDKYKELKKGINSPLEVTNLQKALNKIKPLLNPGLKIDGVFGTNTESLVNLITGQNTTTLKIIELKAALIDPNKYQYNPEKLYI